MMNHELLDAYETDDGEIKFSFYREAGTENDIYVWLQVGQAGVKIPATLVGEFLNVADAIGDYLDELEEDDE